MIRPLRSQLLAAIALLIFDTTARLHAVEALLLQDAYVDNKNNSNLGSNGNLRVTKSGNQVCRSFLKFSLATLPAGITATNVTEARLRLWVDSSSNTLGVDHNDPGDQWVGRADHHEHHKRWPDS